jgi:hypothetical protein
MDEERNFGKIESRISVKNLGIQFIQCKFIVEDVAIPFGMQQCDVIY